MFSIAAETLVEVGASSTGCRHATPYAAWRNKLMATIVDEMGVGASDADYAKAVETLFNRSAAMGNYDNIDVPTLLGGTTDPQKYYQGQHSDETGYRDKLAIVQSDAALRDRLWNVIKKLAEVVIFPVFRRITLRVNWRVIASIQSRGAIRPQRFQSRKYKHPGGEYFFRGDNPFGTAQGRDFIGAGTEQNTREWYRNLRPFTSYPPY